jgi:tetratricopeptide (TPR) repeat protein
MKVIRLALILTCLALCVPAHSLNAQEGGIGGGGPRGENVIYGDVRIEEDKAGGSLKAATYEIVLYSLGGFVLSRQHVGANGRYRFNNLAEGDYDIGVNFEGNEVTRMRVQVRAPVYKTDIRQDIDLAWKNIGQPAKPASITAEDLYKRTAANQKLFDKAQESTDKKKYEESIGFLKQLTANDANDFQALTELGTVYLLSKNLSEAEKAYQQSIAVRPTFFLALLNLGRLYSLEQKYDLAIEPLTKAVETKPTSADANYYLGEAYLQIKKGSKAVGYFYEALKLDPIGRADAHLRLAALYNGANLKDKAAAEYAEFLKKKPDYPDRKKLEQYIAQNKK